jgi:hypothetical protein
MYNAAWSPLDRRSNPSGIGRAVSDTGLLGAMDLARVGQIIYFMHLDLKGWK